MDKRHLLAGAVGLMLMTSTSAVAQVGNSNSFGAKQKAAFQEFRLKAYKEYEEFRLKKNQEYADFMRKAWESMNAEKPIELPKEKEVTPVEITPEEADKPATDKCIFSVALDWVIKVKDKVKESLAGKDRKAKGRKAADVAKAEQIKADNKMADKPANAGKTSDSDRSSASGNLSNAGKSLKELAQETFGDELDRIVLAPEPQEQPKPEKEVKEIPTNVLPMSNFNFKYLGTQGSVRLDKKDVVKIGEISENNLADAWLKLSDIGYVNLIHDCLELRKTHKLCDWAYLLMLKDMAESVCGKDTNEATLLMAYVYCQSGYKMRLAYSKDGSANGGTLYMLYASKHVIFDSSYFTLDGDKFYPFGKNNQTRLYICQQKFPKENSMSLLVKEEPKLAGAYTEPSLHNTSNFIAHPVKVSATSNQNMLDFYTSYPTSMVGGNMLSRWAMYANMPMPEHLKKEVYPQLRQAIEGMSQIDAASTLLTWLHKGFVYDYDDNVWGGDRAFFPEETLHYPYCDCEDRAILYTRLVRDLLGLDCILIYYPGHLACAVNFTTPVSGDYILLGDKRYTVTDPTYLGARIGMTMPNMDNSQAQVILLKDYSTASSSR